MADCEQCKKMSLSTARLIALVAMVLLIVSFLLIIQYGLPQLNALFTVRPVAASTLTIHLSTTSPTTVSPQHTATAGSPEAEASAISDSLLTTIIVHINAARQAAEVSALTHSATLSTVAQERLLNEDSTLQQLASASGYYAETLWSISPTVSSTDASAVVDLLLQSVEDGLTRPEYEDIGIARQSVGGMEQFVLVLGSQPKFTAPGAHIMHPGDSTQSGQEQAILQLLNTARLAAGSPALSINPALTRAALIHSEDQARRNVMGHEGSDGSRPWERAISAGYSSTFVGENVLVRPDLHASGAFDQWWNSLPHHENMMNPEFTEIGIAFSPSETSSYYYTMLLGTP